MHLGQSDLPLPVARERFPSLKIFGLSTHSLAQVEAACKLVPDYIGVGPVYATPTKEIPDATLGLETMQKMIAAAHVPAVAIGGIDAFRLPDVLRAGARNFAVVRAVCRASDPYAAIRRLQETREHI
ncbi:MAG: thiamine phosphate synthase [Opitutales bacterium]|nr:thiamine phosphate synthase [Opitutales bacterium]